MRVLLFFVFLAFTVAAEARLGETPVQCANRYGPPKDTNLTAINDKNFPLLEGAIHHTYEYQGWKIRAAFLQVDGPAVRMDFQKTSAAVSGIAIRDDELQAIMTANTLERTSWKQIPYRSPNLPSDALNRFSQAIGGSLTGEKMWERTDGAILWRRSNLIVRLELPAARQHEEQLKRIKEEKARAAVPKF
jgi:hypothetical protein